MKNIVFLLIISILFLGCQKKKLQPPENITQPLIGKWALVQSAGGSNWHILTPDGLGYTPYIRFYDNNKLRRYRDQSLVGTSTFEFVEMDYTLHFMDHPYAIEFSDEGNYFFNIINDTLTLYFIGNDGYDHIYIRVE